jgi:hypothetical protein
LPNILLRSLKDKKGFWIASSAFHFCGLGGNREGGILVSKLFNTFETSHEIYFKA